LAGVGGGIFVPIKVITFIEAIARLDYNCETSVGNEPIVKWWLRID